MRESTARRLLDKVRDDYDAIAADFSATRTRIWPEMERFRSFVRDGDRVLDVGCGNGRAYQLFEGMAIDYVGLDVSADLVAHARRLHGGMLATFEVGSALDLPHGDGGFDAVLAIASFHHIPSAAFRRRALGEFRRVLGPGGRLLMTNWDRWKPRYAREHLRAAWRMLTGAADLEPGDVLIPWRRGPKKVDRYYHAFTLRGLSRACRAAGFEIVDAYHTRKGERVPWWQGDNLVTICRKPDEGTGEGEG